MVEEVSPAPEPVDAFRRLAHLPFAIFLDSAAPHPLHGRYSYLSALPFEVILGRGRRLEVQRLAARDPGGEDHFLEPLTEAEGDPFALVAERLRAWKAEELKGLPPFQGGAAGLLGYGLNRAVEQLPAPRFDEFQVPDLALGLYDWVLAFDHERGDCHIIAHGFPATAAAERRELASHRVEQVRTLLRSAAPGSFPPPGRDAAPLAQSDLAPQFPLPGKLGLLSNFAKEEYVAAVARAIEYIHAGDIFQVNLSQRLLCPVRMPAAEFYLRLRAANAASFAAYFDLGDFVIASSSPEQFLALSGDEVVTRPIKGTRSRGYTPEEDICRQAELVESEKDRSENVMIVDLLRNDLSRVCQPHTVTVPHLFELESHPTVHHLVSEVRGRLRDGRGALDLLRAAFPGGSITGAPKVRAMEIITELEPTARGPYCGSLGWIAFHGGMGTSILIRTVTIGRGWLQLPAGGGIVADSRPAAEYQETLDKAAGMARALV